MMKIRGMGKLEKRIGKIAKTIDERVKLEISGSDACFIKQRKIHFSILRDYDQDRLYIDNLYATHKDAPELPVYLYGLLHEIGHIHTEATLDDEDIEVREEVMREGDNQRYFALPAERAATAWAVEYAKNNSATVRVLAHKIERAMEKFLQANITE